MSEHRPPNGAGAHGAAHDAERDDIGSLEAIEMFYAYLDGELGDTESIDDFEHHLAHCRSCFTRIEFEQLLTDRLRENASV